LLLHTYLVWGLFTLLLCLQQTIPTMSTILHLPPPVVVLPYS
jgi:hypothetical protein